MITRYVRLNTVEVDVPSNTTVTTTYRWKMRARVSRLWMSSLVLPQNDNPNMTVQITDQDGRSFFTNGVVGSAMPMQMLWGTRHNFYPAQRAKIARWWVPLEIEVEPGDFWTFDVTSGTIAGANPRPCVIAEVFARRSDPARGTAHAAAR